VIYFGFNVRRFHEKRAEQHGIHPSHAALTSRYVVHVKPGATGKPGRRRLAGCTRTGYYATIREGRADVKDMWNAVFLMALGLVTVPGALFGHHGTAVYDTTKLVTVKGTVTEWSWTNPHCLLEFDAKDDKGSVVHWVTETASPTDMINKGWSKQTFKPGDEVAVTMIAAKNGRPLGRVQQVLLKGEALVAEKPPAGIAGHP
jgi:hypothetical protein